MIFAEPVREQAIPSFDNFNSCDAFHLKGCFRATRASITGTERKLIQYRTKCPTPKVGAGATARRYRRRRNLLGLDKSQSDLNLRTDGDPIGLNPPGAKDPYPGLLDLLFSCSTGSLEIIELREECLVVAIIRWFLHSLGHQEPLGISLQSEVIVRLLHTRYTALQLTLGVTSC